MLYANIFAGFLDFSDSFSFENNTYACFYENIFDCAKCLMKCILAWNGYLKKADWRKNIVYYLSTEDIFPMFLACKLEYSLQKKADEPRSTRAICNCCFADFHFSFFHLTKYELNTVLSLYFELFCFLVDWFVWNVWHKFNHILQRNIIPDIF